MAGLNISGDMQQLIAKKRSGNGVDMYNLDKTGSALLWVTKPTLLVDSGTTLTGCVGLPQPARQLLNQQGATF